MEKTEHYYTADEYVVAELIDTKAELAAVKEDLAEAEAENINLRDQLDIAEDLLRHVIDTFKVDINHDCYDWLSCGRSSILADGDLHALVEALARRFPDIDHRTPESVQPTDIGGAN